MPKFDNLPEPKRRGKKEVTPPPPRAGVPDVYEPRCNCCAHEHRRAIDRLLAIGTPHVEINRLFGVSVFSIGRHSKEHLNYEDAAMRALIENEAKQAEENAAEGISRITTRRVFLESYVEKTRLALLNGDLELSGKDAMAAIQMLDNQDQRREGATKDELMGQFAAFQQAIREVCSPEVWDKIRIRTQEIYYSTVEGTAKELEQ